MKSLQSLASFFLIVGLVYYSFLSLMPQKGSPSSVAETKFSTERALIPLKEITKAPHYIGTKEHARVRNYLIGQLEELGLETQVQEGFVINPKWKSLDKPKNIIAKIQGSENGKSLLLLSHYDSALTPSYGASDAGSGVVTILETLRAYKASGKKPKNDIIVDDVNNPKFIYGVCNGKGDFLRKLNKNQNRLILNLKKKYNLKV